MQEQRNILDQDALCLTKILLNTGIAAWATRVPGCGIHIATMPGSCSEIAITFFAREGARRTLLCLIAPHLHPPRNRRQQPKRSKRT
jgi:hypothetical protein